MSFLETIVRGFHSPLITHFQHFPLQWEGLADESIQVIRDKTEFDKSLAIIPLPILCSSY